MSLAIVILAAGQGTRMKSNKQKILHAVSGKPMVAHVFEAARSVAESAPVLVIGPGEVGVQRLFGDQAAYVVQPEQLGTGHAAQISRAAWPVGVDQVLVTYGDMPLLRAATMRQLAETQTATKAAVAMLSVLGEPDSTFGRVIRDADGRVIEIVEVAEARQRPNAELLLDVRELNLGVYCFAADWLRRNLDQLPLRQARSGPEYYLTDLVAIAVAQGELVSATIINDPDECLGAGTRTELTAVEKAFRRRANQHWLNHGVTLVDPDTTYIDQDAFIGQDTIIWPGSHVQGHSYIDAGCVIGPNSIIRNAHLGQGCRVEQAVVENVWLPPGTQVRPFSHISEREGRWTARHNAKIGGEVHDK
jgi:bifunctional UDP-N-acetylglucosamine pyrophosphorylase/glucosamine-1-phosphate N-acetyltransferase